MILYCCHLRLVKTKLLENDIFSWERKNKVVLNKAISNMTGNGPPQQEKLNINKD